MCFLWLIKTMNKKQTDIFPQADVPQANVPLADRMRPRTLDEVVGQEHLIGPGKVLSAT